MKTKTLTILLSLLAYAGSLIAQPSNLVVFSNTGQKFTVILNGVRQNPTPQTNVKITGLTQPGYEAKIIFVDPKIAPIDKKVYFQPGMEEVTVIKQNRKGDYVLRMQSAVAIAQAPPTPATQTVIVYGATPEPTPPPVQNTGTVSSTTVTTSTTATPNDNVGVGMNVGGIGVSMNVNGGNMNATGTTTTTTTTTTTSNVGTNPPPRPNYYAHSEHHYEHHGGYYDHHDNGHHYGEYDHHENHQHYANGCYGPMSPSDFASAKSSIENQSFSDGKMKVAKQILGSNCMSSEQVKEIMGLFSFESSKLKFAEFAYGRTTDPQNFYKLNDAFSFSSSVDELDKYIKSHPAQ